jgi:hypothetical protein
MRIGRLRHPAGACAEPYSLVAVITKRALRDEAI